MIILKEIKTAKTLTPKVYGEETKELKKIKTSLLYTAGQSLNLDTILSI